MPELVAELLRRALLSLSNLAAIHEDVVVVFNPIDPDRPECEIFKEHLDRMLRLPRNARRDLIPGSHATPRRNPSASLLNKILRHFVRVLRMPLRSISPPAIPERSRHATSRVKFTPISGYARYDFAKVVVSASRRRSCAEAKRPNLFDIKHFIHKAIFGYVGFPNRSDDQRMITDFDELQHLAFHIDGTLFDQGSAPQTASENIETARSHLVDVGAGHAATVVCQTCHIHRWQIHGESQMLPDALQRIAYVSNSDGNGWGICTGTANPGHRKEIRLFVHNRSDENDRFWIKEVLRTQSSFVHAAPRTRLFGIPT